jgi:hypothetical protein
LQSRDWPGNWLYPSTSGYAAQLGDNGNVVSSLNTTAGLTVTLPATTGLPSGWSMGFATDQGKSLKIQVNGTSGGHILYPLVNASGQSSLTLAGDQYEYVTLQYDGSGDFRVEQMTPATAQQLGVAGIGGVSRWSFPSASAYAAAVADNGNAISAYNSPLSYLTVTLPAANTLNVGRTIAVANDSGKVAAAQITSGDTARILYPSSGASSLQLAAGNYEMAVLQFDGSNFRVMQLTPSPANSLGVTGTGCTPKSNFPSVSSYSATLADCGSVISSYNSPIASLTVTLPSQSVISTGWSVGFTTDNGKALIVQVNGTSGGQILLPGDARRTIVADALRPELRISGARIRRLELPHHVDDTGQRLGQRHVPGNRHTSLVERRVPDRPGRSRQQLPLLLHRAECLEALGLEQLLKLTAAISPSPVHRCAMAILSRNRGEG